MLEKKSRISLRNWFSAILQKPSSRRSRASQGLDASQQLESRHLLAGVANFAKIEGKVFHDANGDGSDTGDAVIGGATVRLYFDDGNGTFGPEDALEQIQVSEADGTYKFLSLCEGTFFVETEPPAGFDIIAPLDPQTVVITPEQAGGATGLVIDTHNQPTGGQRVRATPTQLVDSSALDIPGVLGGERDLIVRNDDGPSVSFAYNFDIPGFFEYDAAFGSIGSAEFVYDGDDNDPLTIDYTGLGGVDLTNQNDVDENKALKWSFGADHEVNLFLTVYTDETHASEAVLTVPDTGGATVEEVVIRFSEFTQSGVDGPADFTNVGAFVGRFSPTVASTQVVSDFVVSIAEVGISLITGLHEPITIGESVFNDANNNGVLDGTETGIAGVALTLFQDTNANDTYDDGIDTQVDTTTSGANGAYSFTGVAPGTYFTRIDASNFATDAVLDGFLTSDGNDPTPDPDTDTAGDDNGFAEGGYIITGGLTLVNGAEPTDDGDGDANTNLTVGFGVFQPVDIDITNTDNVDPVAAGSGTGNLVYTITAANIGDGNATGVTVANTDLIPANLPAGFSFVSAVGSNGSTFDSSTGIWTVGNIDSGGSETLTVTLTVASSVPAGTQISNTASVDSVNEAQLPTALANDSDSETTDVVRLIDIEVTTSDNSDPVIAGSGTGNMVYTVDVTNLGPSDATGLTVLNDDILPVNLPPGVTLVSVVPDVGTFNTTNGIWTVGGLGPNDSATLTVTLTADETAADDLQVSNTASLSNVTEPEIPGGTANNSDSEVTDIDRRSDIVVSKSDNADPVIAGDGTGNLVYTITAGNQGPSNASGLVVLDDDVIAANLPTGFVFESASGSNGTTFDESTGLWTIGDLDLNATETLTITLTVDHTVADNLQVSNTASVNSLNEIDPLPASNTDTELTEINRNVDIVVSKTTTTNPVIAGSGPGNLVYTITASNNGPSTASGVVVLDDDIIPSALPTEVSFVSAVGSDGTSFNSTNGLWSVGTLAPGDSQTLTITLTVDASASDSLQVGNTASLEQVNETETDPSNDSGTTTAEVDREVDIAITKTDVSDPVTAGSGTGNLIYTITAENQGPSDASGLTVIDSDVINASLPAGFQFESASGTNGTTFDPSTGIWTIGDLNNGDTETLTITLTVDSTVANNSTLSGTAVLNGVNEPDTDAANNSATETTTILREIDIVVTGTGTTNAIAGSGDSNITHTITVTNNGPSRGSGVVVRVDDVIPTALPEGVTFVSADGSNGSTFDPTTGLWTITTLDDGASETLTVTLTAAPNAIDSGQVINVAELEATNENEVDQVSGNDTDTVTTDIARQVDIAVTKSDNVDPVTASNLLRNLVYTVTATNLGPSDASGVTILDDDVIASALPAGIQFESASGTNGTTFDATTGIWDVGVLAPNQTETLTIELSVTPAVSEDDYSNTASVNSVNETDISTANDSSTEVTGIARLVDVIVRTSDNRDPIVAGGTIPDQNNLASNGSNRKENGDEVLIHTVTARNAGPGTATNVEVAVPNFLAADLPLGMTVASIVGSNGSTYDTVTGIWSVGTLAPGQIETLTATFNVDASTNDNITYINAARLSSVDQEESDATDASNSDSEPTLVVRRVDLAVLKSSNPNPVVAGSGDGNLVYTIEVRNEGPSDASGVTVIDEDVIPTALPAGVNFDSAVGSGGTTFNPTNGVWTVGDLADGEIETLTITLTVDESASDSLRIENTARINSVNETETDTSDDSSTVITEIDRIVDIEVRKTENADPIIAGSGQENLVYTVTATNIGPSDASGVIIRDDDVIPSALPAGVSFVSAVGTGTSTFNSVTGLWDIGELETGTTETLTITLTVGAAAADNARITNTAELESVNETEVDDDPERDRETITTDIDRRVDVALSKTVNSSTVVPGSGDGNVVFTVTATNFGPSDASGVSVLDQLVTDAQLPAGVEFVSANGTGTTSFNQNTGLWAIGELPAGATETLTLTLTATSSAADEFEFCNIVTVQNVNEIDTQTSNDEVKVITDFTRSADLQISKRDLVDPVTSADPIVYVIDVLNVGPSDASGVVVTDNLPSIAEFVSAIPSTGTATHSAGIVTANLGTLASGETASVTVTITVDLPQGGELVNVASVTSDDPDPQTPNNSTEERTTVEAQFGSFSGFVFEDTNQNGRLDSTEAGLGNAQVTLFGLQEGGEFVVRPIRTDGSGQYEFAELLPGNYNIYQLQPERYSDSGDFAGQGVTSTVLDDAFINVPLDGGVDATDFRFTEGPIDDSKRSLLYSGRSVGEQSMLTGVPTGTSSLSGTVSFDMDQSNTLTAGDRGLAASLITLSGMTDSGDPVILQQTTNTDGSFSFQNLPAGRYNIQQQQPSMIDDGPDEIGTVLPASTLDDLFIDILLAEGQSGTGFNFLESTTGSTQTATDIPQASGLTPADTGVLDTTPLLSWNAVPGATAYNLQLVNEQTGSEISNTQVTGTQFTTPQLATGSYRYWIQPVIGSVVGRWSDAAEFSVDEAPEIVAPEVVTASSSPRLAWNHVEAAICYDVWVNSLDGGPALLYRNQHVVGDSIQLEGLSDGRYRFWVRAEDALGNRSSWSSGQTFSISSQPEILSPQGALTGAPTFEWTPGNEQVTHYDVWVSNRATGLFLRNENVTNTQLQFNEIFPAGNYRVWVRGLGENFATKWSAASDFTIGSLSAPDIFSPQAVGNQTQLSWAAVDGAARYEIWVNEIGGQTRVIHSTDLTSSSLTASLNGGRYRMWIRAISNTGHAGDWTTGYEFTV